MMRLCNCTGGSASLEQSRKRAATASCRTCGGKQLIDGKESISGSMLSTVGLELTNFINTELTWKKVSKGNRSAPRRARKPVARSLKERTRDLVDKDPKRVVDMPVSDSEKHGVTILGHRFSDKVEHVPIKKRRFLFQAPSPPSQTPSPCHKESEEGLKRPPASSENGSSPKSIVKQQLSALDAAVAIELGQVDDSEIVDGNNSNEINEKLSDDEDFSGISILAAAACNNSVVGDGGNPVEEGSVVESFALEGPHKILVNNESPSVAKGLSKEHNSDCAETNEGTDSCISEMPVEEISASLGTVNSFPKDPAHGMILENPSISHSSASMVQNLPNDRDDGTLRRPGSSLRDDRSYWDLNTVMDAWEHPYPIVDTQRNDADCISQGGCKTQKESVDSETDNVRKMCPVVGRMVSSDVHGNIDSLAKPRSLVLGACESNREEQKSDACPRPDGTTCLQEKVLLPSETDSPPHSVVDSVDEMNQSVSEERIKSNAETVVPDPIEHAVESSSLDIPDANASIQCLSLSCVGNGESLPFYQVVTVDAPVDHSPCSGSYQIISKLESEENRNAASTGTVRMRNEEVLAFDAQTDQTLGRRSNQAEKQEILEKATYENDKVLENDSVKADSVFSSYYGGASHVKTMSMDTCLPLEPGPLDDIMETAVSKLENVNVFESSPEGVSGASVGKGQSVVAVVEVLQHGSKDSGEDTTEVNSSIHIGEELTHKLSGQAQGSFSSHEGCKSCDDDPVNSSGKVALEEDAFDDIFDSDVSEDDPRHMVGMEKACEIQAGYDSQYEDGEFREPTIVNWEEYADEEGETECVDYGSDNRDTDGFDAADYPVSLLVQIENGGYKSDRSADVDPFGCEDSQFMNKQKLEIGRQPYSVGALTVDAMEGGSSKKIANRAVKTPLRMQFAGKDEIEKSQMDDTAYGGTNAGTKKVIGEDTLCERGDPARDSTQSANLSMKMSGWDQLAEGCKNSTDIDGSARKNHFSNRTDELDVEGSMTRVVGSKVPRRELLSRIEGPESSDVVMKDRVFKQGSRPNNIEDLDRRAERESRFVKPIGGSGTSLPHGRGPPGDRWIDSSKSHWGLRRHHSPSYHGPGGFGRPEADNAAAAAAAKVESSGFIVAPDGTIVKPGGSAPNVRIHRSINPSSHGVRRSLARRGSPSDRDEAFSMHMGVGAMGEMSPDRNIVGRGRGRFGRYGSRVVGRGPRERYHGHVPDESMESSFQMPHPLNRRERSFSPPTQRRGAPRLSRSQTKSPSRSRTCSPNAWPSPKGRNGAGVGSCPSLRHRSRSPNLRSESRMERGRSPYRQPGFAAEHMDGFGSLPRRRGSPQHSPRWMDDRRDMDDHLREHSYRQRTFDRRSPRRIFHRSHRFDILDTPGRLKPDEYYNRPMHPARFPEMIGGSRGSRYEGSDDDRRKHDHRYGMIHPVRRYGMDGSLKRFRYDVEDDFLAHNSHNKDAREYDGRGSPKDYDSVIDSRLGDAPRRAREEKDNFRYGRGRRFIASSKSFEMREFDEDVAPRRRRPS